VLNFPIPKVDQPLPYLLTVLANNRRAIFCDECFGWWRYPSSALRPIDGPTSIDDSTSPSLSSVDSPPPSPTAPQFLTDIMMVAGQVLAFRNIENARRNPNVIAERMAQQFLIG
jgi:hypothetical protein